MTTYTMTEDQLEECHRKLNLIKSILHHNRMEEIGIYPSANRQIATLIDELGAQLERRRMGSAAGTTTGPSLQMVVG